MTRRTPSDSLPTVALVYDRVNSQGGAERVLQELHTLYPQAPLFTSVYDPLGAPWAAGWDVRTSWLRHVPGAARRHRWFGWLMPWIFRSLDLSAFEVVITVSSESAKAVRTHSNQLHIDYLLTPTRYLWSHRVSTLRSLPTVARPLAKYVLEYLARVDREDAHHPDYQIAISQLVADRAQRFYGRIPDKVVYPPVSIAATSQSPARVPHRPFVVVWGRHVAYKRLDWAIRAACQLRITLVVLGDGPQTQSLRRLAQWWDPLGRYVTFVGRVPDEQLRWYLERAVCAWFPQVEDFGIAQLEASLAGCPVVAAVQSGASELQGEQDGVFFAGTSYPDFVRSAWKAYQYPWSRLDIQRRAQHYAGVRFRMQWDAIVSAWWQQRKQLHHKK